MEDLLKDSVPLDETQGYTLKGVSVDSIPRWVRINETQRLNWLPIYTYTRIARELFPVETLPEGANLIFTLEPKE